MKKYITLAALLAAGTACANAATELLTLTSPTDGSLTSSNAAVAWSEAYASLESWEISFTLTDAALGDAILFGTDRTSGGAAGYILSTNADGSLEVYSRNINGVSFSESTIAGVVTAGTGIDITFSFVADVNETTKEVVGGNFYLTAGSTSNSWSVTEGLDYTDLVNNDVSRFWTNGGAEKFSDITVSKLDSNVVPEPSAFGLLAGVGALALVASRRRRR